MKNENPASQRKAEEKIPQRRLRRSKQKDRKKKQEIGAWKRQFLEGKERSTMSKPVEKSNTLGIEKECLFVCF